MELLKRFNADIHTREALKEFIKSYIDQEGLRRIYEGKEVSGVKDAKEIIDGVFEYLNEINATPNKQKENTNEAR